MRLIPNISQIWMFEKRRFVSEKAVHCHQKNRVQEPEIFDTSYTGMAAEGGGVRRQTEPARPLCGPCPPRRVPLAETVTLVTLVNLESVAHAWGAA